MRPLIAANWKMHGDVNWVEKPARLNALISPESRTSIDVLICPPFPLISALRKQAHGLDIHIGAQNCHAAVSGAHTGEVSAEMLTSAGADYVIVGHSERRAEGETDADVKAKAEAAHRAGLVPIICVGESLDQRKAGEAQIVVSDQIAASRPESEGVVVIAYEPIWAIGTGETASLDDIAEMHQMIRDQVGKDVRILYGGSVKPGNAEGILGTAHVNGALIGGASLEMDSLAEICRAAMAGLE